MDEIELTIANNEAPTPITNEEASQLSEEALKNVEYRNQQEAYRLQQQESNEQLTQQKESEIEDSRNKKNWGIGEYTNELFSAIGGGVQDTASSLVTLPERLIDFATGEMGRENKEGGYKPEWDDWFVNDENPIETKTWWGGAIRGLTHYGTLAAIPFGKIGVLAKTGKAASSVVPAVVKAPIGAALKAKGLKGAVAKGMVSGAKVDLLSRYSQDTNALGVLESHFTGLNIPLATKEHDHPMMKTFKNVVEGMGLGILSDTVLHGMKIGFRKTKTAIGDKIPNKPTPTPTTKVDEGAQVVQANKDSREIQRVKKGKIQANGSKSDQARLKEIEKQLGGNPNDALLDSLTAQRAVLKKQKKALVAKVKPDDVEAKKQIQQLTDDIKEYNLAVKI